MTENPFVLPVSEYKRDINVLNHYLDQASEYLSLMTDTPREEALNFIKSNLKPGGQFEFKDPKVTYLRRKDNGDREKMETTLSQYLAEAVKEKELIAPTFTIYVPPHKKKSLLVDFIDDNIAARSKAKKEMFAAEGAGNKFLQELKKNEQQNKKLRNNACSGAHVSNSTPLYNKTAHSTLTSNCRSTSGYGNANNEKFLCGNRHYWSPDIVRNNIISIIKNSDFEAIEKVMVKYGIRYPSVEDTVQCIKFSSQQYWWSEFEEGRIQKLVEKLSPIQRAAFVYTGDLYHLRKLNEDIVRSFITQLSTKIDVEHPNAEAVLKAAPESYRFLAVQICADIMKGKKLDKIVGTPEYRIVASTTQNIVDVMQSHIDLIRAFWVTPNVPASLAVFPSSIRHAAITSDTDSTIFTVQDWVLWSEGRMSFDSHGVSVGATMVFLASEAITHVLARMSANFGIEEKRLFQIAMKNEYYFPVFIPTQVAKHYYASMSCQEGFIKPEIEREVKGVHLKSSNAPRKIIAEAKSMMNFIMDTVMAEKKISIRQILKRVAKTECEVEKAVRSGSYEYFRRIMVKAASTYKEGDQNSNYKNYTLWRDTFGHKYNYAEEPPYVCLKLSVDLSSRAKTLDWLQKVGDPEFENRVLQWMEKNNKKDLGSQILVPEQFIQTKGIPDVLLPVMGVRKMILDSSKIFYIILESLGIYMLNKRMTRLVSDYHRVEDVLMDN